MSAREISARLPAMRRLLAPMAALCCAACGGGSLDGEEILVPFDGMHGGLLFASAVTDTSNGYDLFWAPLPPSPTIDAQPMISVTHFDGEEWQPSASRGGRGIAFSHKDHGIYLITTSGRITRISDTGDGERFRDSVPAVSFDGTKVAWVREDHGAPLGETGFVETYVMIADFDGRNAHAVFPRSGIIQDAPVFEPGPTATKLAWSEFSAASLTVSGPQTYGIWVHDLVNVTGRYICTDPGKIIGDRPRPYRCFGQHLVWPFPSEIHTGQDLLRIDVITNVISTIWPEVVVGLQQQTQIGIPDIGLPPSGFFPRFPISLSVSPNGEQIVFDGVVTAVDGDLPTLGFFAASIDGGGVWRIPIAGLTGDIDQANTADYTFSVATPQIVP